MSIEYRLITNLEELYMANQESVSSTKPIIHELISNTIEAINKTWLNASTSSWACNIVDKDGNSIHVITATKQYALDLFTNDYDMKVHDYYVVPFEYAYRKDGVFGVVRLDNHASMWFEEELEEL